MTLSVRRWALALTAIAAAVSVGCSGEPSPPQAEPKAEEKVEEKTPPFTGSLQIWSAPGLAGLPTGYPETAWFSERARAFEAENQGVQVTIVEYPDPHALEEALASKREKPDVVFARPIAEVMDDVAAIDAYLTPDTVADFWPDTWKGFRHGSSVGGVPLLVDARAMAVNRQAFAPAGPLPDNWSHAEFAAALARLKGAGVYGFGFYHLPGFYDWWTLTGADPSGVTEEGLRRLVGWIRRDGWGDPDIARRSAEETWAAFAAGRFALMPAPGWALPLLRSEPYRVDLDVAPLPGPVRTAGFVYGALVFKHADPLRVEAATRLALTLASPGDLIPLARKTGTMPARRSSGNPFDGDPAMSRLWTLAQSHAPLPAGPAWKRAEKEIWREYQLALLGGRPSAEAVENVRSHITSSSATSGR